MFANLFLRAFIFFIFLFIFPSCAFGKISFDENGKWSTSFDYGPCSQRGVEGEISCEHVENDGITWNWGAGVGPGDTYTQVTPDAKRPGSKGKGGARFWKYDGVNLQSGLIKADFPEPQTEIWIRWYMRYQEGFQWEWYGDSSDCNKLIRFHPKSSPLFSLYPHGFVVYSEHTAQSTGAMEQSFPSTGWDDLVFGTNPEVRGSSAHGGWHSFEVYMKMDTEGEGPFRDPSIPYNGIVRLWIDGVMVGERFDFSFSGGDPEVREGWTLFTFSGNQRRPDNENGPIGVNYAYEDWDDMVIYNRTPPNIDNYGNPFIGPADWGSDTADLMPPQNVHFKSQ